VNREHWIGMATALGDQVLHDDGSIATMRPAQRKPRNAMHVTILFMLFLLGFATFFLTWMLILPYLIVIAVLNARIGSSTAVYRLWVDREGRPVTVPSGMVWRLHVESERLRGELRGT
jgi:hypothetical protein